MAGERIGFRSGVIVAILSVSVVALIVAVTRAPETARGPNELPLAAPTEPSTTTTLPPPRPFAPSDGWRLAVQSSGALWEIDGATGGMTLIEPATDSLPRGGAVAVMRTGDREEAEEGSGTGGAFVGGDIVLIESDGREAAFGADLPVFRLPPPVEQNSRFALTPRPVALVPVRAADDLLLIRAGLDGVVYDDVPLPACGESFPIAAGSTDRVFGVWCQASDDLRLFYDGPDELVEVRVTDIRADGLMPAVLRRGDKPLLVDPFGGVWGFSLFEQAFEDLSMPIAGVDGSIPLADDERILGIAAISDDFEHVVVGVSSGSDFDATVTASRLAGYDPLGFTDGWSVAAPVPVVSLVGAPDGKVYGLGTDDDGGVLLAIDPAGGQVEILHVGLAIDRGRLMVLP